MARGTGPARGRGGATCGADNLPRQLGRRHQPNAANLPAPMEFEDIAAALEGVPIISRERGRELYDHVRRTRPARMLDVGTHRGASAAYMAAAAAANGAGEVT